EKLPAIQNSDRVKEHDQTGQPNRSDDLSLRSKGAECQAHEQNSSDAERKPEDVDLTNQVTQADGKEQRENRLGPDNVAGQVNHDEISPGLDMRKLTLAGVATRRAKLLDDSVHQF